MQSKVNLVAIGTLILYFTILQTLLLTPPVDSFNRAPGRASWGWGRISRDKSKGANGRAFGRAAPALQPMPKPKGKSSTNSDITQEQCEGYNATFHPTKCNGYYKCEGSGSKYTLSFADCPAGQYYESLDRACAPGNCRYEAFPGESGYGEQLAGYTCNTYLEGISESSKQFIIERACQPDEHYDAKVKQCVDGACTAISPPPKPPTSAPAGFKQLQCIRYDKRPHPNRCNAYTICDEKANKVSYMACPEGQHFDRLKRGCVPGRCHYENYPGECMHKEGKQPATKAKECKKRDFVWLVIEEPECDAGTRYCDNDMKCVPTATSCSPFGATAGAGGIAKPMPKTTSKPVSNSSGGSSGPSKPEAGEACNPVTCAVEGYCFNYTFCKREETSHGPADDAGVLMAETCGRDHSGVHLYFNGEKNMDHGGVCDYWKNLDPALKTKYKNDESCIPPKCKFKADSPCSNDYNYSPGGVGAQYVKLTCPDRLVWDDILRTCRDPCLVAYLKEDGSQADCSTLLGRTDCTSQKDT